MGRMHSFGKGMSKSALPWKRTPPSWCKATTREVVETIVKMAKKGFSPSRIGITLRDTHGIPQVKHLTGRKILRILKHQGVAPTIPEDLYSLIKKAVSVKGHLDRQKRDYDAKYHLYTIESRVHRLARYYRRVKQLPAAWQYDSKTAKALVA